MSALPTVETERIIVNPLKNYLPRNYENLIGMEGFSEKLLRNHFKLYQGYVTNTNKQIDILSRLQKDGADGKSPEYAEIKRRFGWEFNGMRLHEYYFDNLGGNKKLDGNSLLARMLDSQFGSFDEWKKDFVATGGMRGIGWAALYMDPQTQRLINFWIEEHNENHLANGNLILLMDVFEHAFMIDYGTEKSGYIEAFFKNINWDVAVQRCHSAISKSSE